jgi:VWFA-related protein
MGRRFRRFLVASFLAVLVAGVAAAQDPPHAPVEEPPTPQVTVVYPTAEDVLFGPLKFEVKLDPPDTPYSSIDVFVDDKRACRITRAPLTCTWDAGGALVPRIVKAAGYLNGRPFAVSSWVTTRGLDELAETTGVHSIQLPATVQDDDGNYVASLKEGAFEVYEDGVRQAVTFFKAENVQMEIVIAVDISGSMHDDLAVLKKSVRRFVESVRPIDTLKVMAFNDHPFVLPSPVRTPPKANGDAEPEPSAPDYSALLEKTDRLSATGGTALYDTIIRAIKELPSSLLVGRAVIVFSDGKDTASTAGPETVERFIKQSDVRLFLIVQGDELKEPEVRKVIRKLTEISGGKAYAIDKIGELESRLMQILADVQHQYLLAYTPTNDKKDGTTRKISVRLKGAKGTVNTRTGYTAPKG